MTKTTSKQHHQIIDAMTEACHEAHDRGEDVMAALISLRDEATDGGEFVSELQSLMGETRLEGSRRDIVDTVIMHVDLETGRRAASTP